jgi:hypothetical protein
MRKTAPFTAAAVGSANFGDRENVTRRAGTTARGNPSGDTIAHKVDLSSLAAAAPPAPDFARRGETKR